MRFGLSASHYCYVSLLPCLIKLNPATRMPLLQPQTEALTTGPSSYSCTTAMDCELLCACVSGACVCRKGWKGGSCGTVDLTPIAAPPNSSAIRGAIWPPTAALLDNSTFSWGFTVVYDETTSLYHAAVNVGCCGLEKNAHWPTGGTCGVTAGGTFLLLSPPRDL